MCVCVHIVHTRNSSRKGNICATKNNLTIADTEKTSLISRKSLETPRNSSKINMKFPDILKTFLLLPTVKGFNKCFDIDSLASADLRFYITTTLL